jgi:broad specificity phosphatase PhoE
MSRGSRRRGGRSLQKQHFPRFPVLRLIFIRHGETNYNLKKIMQGSIDAPLNGRGIAQARAVARRLAREKIDFIYSSPMRRARETAEEIARLHPGLQLEIIPALFEQSFGRFEGRPISEWREWKKTRPNQKSLDDTGHGGESWIDLDRRTAPFVSKLLAMRGKTVVVVSHGSVARATIARILGIPLENSRSLFMDNASVAEIVVAPEFTKLASFNDSAHLRGIF